MRVSTILPAALAGLSFGLFPQLAFGQRVGDVCARNRDCRTRCCGLLLETPTCQRDDRRSEGRPCFTTDGCDCEDGLLCEAGVCTADIGDDLFGDPHMKGLRGQRIDWSGIDGGWYSLVKDDRAGLDINVRLTAPLAADFPDRQLVTGLGVVVAAASEDGEGGARRSHSLAVEVKNPYAVGTEGCPEGVSPCLADGGLRIVVDGQQVDELLRFSRDVPVAGGGGGGGGDISVSASNLPAECRQFGGDKVWARVYQEMMNQGGRRLGGGGGDGQSLEDWILSFDRMAAPGWCAKYIAENDLSDLQSTHAIFRIETPSVTVRLNAGVNYQGDDGELDWAGRALPELDFWQMDVGIDGLDLENPALSGILGETARPVYGDDGRAVMEGFGAFRGAVEDYRVSGALGTRFALLEGGSDGGAREYDNQQEVKTV